jgi:hypothetical protein
VDDFFKEEQVYLDYICNTISAISTIHKLPEILRTILNLSSFKIKQIKLRAKSDYHQWL